MNERRGIYDKSKKDKNNINGDKSNNAEKKDKNNNDSKNESDDEDNLEEISHPYLFFHTDKDKKVYSYTFHRSFSDYYLLRCTDIKCKGTAK